MTEISACVSQMDCSKGLLLQNKAGRQYSTPDPPAIKERHSSPDQGNPLLLNSSVIPRACVFATLVISQKLDKEEIFDNTAPSLFEFGSFENSAVLLIVGDLLLRSRAIIVVPYPQNESDEAEISEGNSKRHNRGILVESLFSAIPGVPWCFRRRVVASFSQLVCAVVPIWNEVGCVRRLVHQACQSYPKVSSQLSNVPYSLYCRITAFLHLHWRNGRKLQIRKASFFFSASDICLKFMFYRYFILSTQYCTFAVCRFVKE